MGFLNQSIQQIRDLFASMTPAARITAGLLLAVIGVSLGYLFQDYSHGSKEFLLNGETMQPREADRMEAAIAKAGLSDYERQGNRILVPRGKKSAYLAAVANAGALPANLDRILLDESADMGMFLDRKTRDDRMKAAREQMLSMIIRQMDGVEDANVLFDSRESKGFEEQLVTATVSVRPAAGQELDGRRVKNIREAVAHAIPGLKAKDVAILNLSDDTRFQVTSATAPETFEERYFQEKTRYEQMMKANIENLLRHIGGIQVQVTADLDETLTSESRQVSSSGDPVAIREQTNETSNVKTQSEDRGPPGPTSQGPSRTPAEQAVAKNEDTSTVNTRDADNLVPTTEEVVSKSGLVPKHVRAAIAVPSDYLVSVWRERNPTVPADQRPTKADLDPIENENIDSIKRVVGNLFPPEPGQDNWPNVQLTFFQSKTPAPVVPPSMASTALAWASSNSGSLIMAGLAFAALLMLRSMMKSIPAPETNVVLTLPAAEGGDEAVAGYVGGAAAGGSGEAGGAPRRSGGEKGRPKLRLKKGANLRDDLTDMVREDPDAAAAILRTWITSAG